VHLEVDISLRQAERRHEVAQFVALIGAQRLAAGLAIDENLYQPTLAHQLVGVHGPECTTRRQSSRRYSKLWAPVVPKPGRPSHCADSVTLGIAAITIQ
jgi:hypothetical protein